MIWLALLACSGSTTVQSTVSLEAQAIEEAECAVCGMIVGEQPAPRGQVVRRDGTHEFVCSVEELRALTQNPSSKGKPRAVYVEALPTTLSSSGDTTPLPWVPVDEAWFVFGAERRGVMGTPVLAFGDEAAARLQGDSLGSTPVRWAPLRDTPFSSVPQEARVQTPTP